MVIFVAGLVGTGKTSLSQALSKKLGIFHYDVDEIKKLIYPTDPDYESNLKNSIPFSEETRAKVFNRVVEDFPQLAKEHKHIIVEEVLNRKNLRQILFDGADKYFGGYIIVWVKSDEAIIKRRLESNQREGHILKNPFGMYLSLKQQYQDFDNADIVFENNGTLEEAANQLTELVKHQL